jgi:hypothetical protein
MIYEIMLARLLSVVTWYYLALAAVGMAMSGMTAGALVVQLKPSFFEQTLHERRIRQGAFAMALALPLGLVGMLAVPRPKNATSASEIPWRRHNSVTFVAALSFPQNADDLFLTEPRSLHACLPFRQTPTYRWDTCRGKGHPI